MVQGLVISGVGAVRSGSGCDPDVGWLGVFGIPAGIDFKRASVTDADGNRGGRAGNHQRQMGAWCIQVPIGFTAVSLKG